jgi:general secretion pathway protein H
MIRNGSDRKGFTLLELLVVLVIIGAMVSMVAPRMTGTLSNLNAKTTARKIAASLRYARSIAASEKAVYRAQFDLVSRQFLIEKLEGSSTRIKFMGEPRDDAQILHSHRFQEELFFTFGEDPTKKSEMNVFSILFYPSGGSSGGDIIIGDAQGEGYRIRVDFITGSVRLFET